MGHYSDSYWERETQDLIDRYGSKNLPALTERNLAYNIARANKAETELHELKNAFRTLKSVLS